MITVIHISHSLYKTRLVTQKKPYRKTIHISHSLYKTDNSCIDLPKYQTFTYHIVYIKPIEQEIQAEMKDCDSHIT